MSCDEEVNYAAIAAVSQAKMALYSPLLKDENINSTAVGADARTLAKMLVAEEKKVLGDLRHQLMSVVSHSAYCGVRPFPLFRRHSYVHDSSVDGQCIGRHNPLWLLLRTSSKIHQHKYRRGLSGVLLLLAFHLMSESAHGVNRRPSTDDTLLDSAVLAAAVCCLMRHQKNGGNNNNIEHVDVALFRCECMIRVNVNPSGTRLFCAFSHEQRGSVSKPNEVSPRKKKREM